MIDRVVRPILIVLFAAVVFCAVFAVAGYYRWRQ
jgi:hypothetical protein